ncbi:MAG: orotidine-5'-phosphate decarboxylase [Firmicutes bacterium]|nr:orotidine-5'-phosphate decarboxylase [Bacillota bacterium]
MRERLILALDLPTLREAEEVVRELRGEVGFFKIGLELFCATGPAAVEMVHRHGGRVFLDLKFHDIPNTVAGAVRRGGAMGVEMLNLHAAAGTRALSAAVEAAREMASAHGRPAPVLLGVTVLTSLSAEDLAGQNIAAPVEQQVATLAAMVHAAGLDGVVCAGSEVRTIKRTCGKGFLTVVPGVRPAWAATGDQRRTMTPAEALVCGADYLVLGRPVLASADRRSALARILAEMEEAIDA